MQRRIASDCALSSIMAPAVPVAPLGARATQWYADADVEIAVAIAIPINVAAKKKTHDRLPDVYAHKILNCYSSKSRFSTSIPRIRTRSALLDAALTTVWSCVVRSPVAKGVTGTDKLAVRFSGFGRCCRKSLRKRTAELQFQTIKSRQSDF